MLTAEVLTALRPVAKFATRFVFTISPRLRAVKADGVLAFSATSQGPTLAFQDLALHHTDPFLSDSRHISRNCPQPKKKRPVFSREVLIQMIDQEEPNSMVLKELAAALRVKGF